MTLRDDQVSPLLPEARLVIGGGVVAALGPLFALLTGSMIGSATDTGDLSPIYLLFLGILVGGLGIGATLLGIQHPVRHKRTPHDGPRR